MQESMTEVNGSQSNPPAGHVRQRRFVRRSRKGCITCKKRRKKCDEGHPSCTNCLRISANCIWADTVDTGHQMIRSQAEFDPFNGTVEPHRRLAGRPTSGPLRNFDGMLGPSLSSTGSLPTEQRFLISYYIRSLVPTISVVSDPNTFYVGLYVPMAFHSEGVLNAILACAATHLAKTTDNEDRAEHYAQVANVHQRLCHDLLLRRVYNANISSQESDLTIAVVLLLIGLEIQTGNNMKFAKQLKSVRKIVQARGGAQHFMNAGWESQSLYSHFLYHDVMASVMEEIEDEEYSSPIGYSDLNMELETFAQASHTLDPLMGASSTLFLLIRQVTAFRQFDSGLERQQAFFRLETAINAWSLKDWDTSALRGLDLAAELDLIALAETYRLGALILLYRTSSSHHRLLPKISKQILAFVARIPDGNQVEAGLTYPLFLAGGELTDWEDMEACALKLRGIRQRTKILNIRGVEELLETVWRVRLNGESCNWAEILRNEGRIICIA